MNAQMPKFINTSTALLSASLFLLILCQINLGGAAAISDSTNQNSPLIQQNRNFIDILQTRRRRSSAMFEVGRFKPTLMVLEPETGAGQEIADAVQRLMAKKKRKTCFFKLCDIYGKRSAYNYYDNIDE